MIVVLDLEMNNQKSIEKMIKKIGYNPVVLSNNFELINKASAFILPGIGTFDYTMSQIKKFQLIEILNEKIIKQRLPILGICVGMQILFQKSEEGSMLGLNWLPGSVQNLSQRKKLNDFYHKVPHVGWNNVEMIEKNLINRNLNDASFYFAHSYYVNTTENIVSTTKHIEIFPSIINCKNIYGCQFHPEKSHSSGYLFLKNFINLI